MKVDFQLNPIPVDKMPGAAPASPVQQAGQGFADMLKNSISEVQEAQETANQSIQDLASGRHNRIHETMMAMENADLSFRMLTQVRNKVLDAYREMLRMSV